MPPGIWDQVLARVETKVNRHSFYTWFQPTTLISDGGSTLFVRIPNPVFREWLNKHYTVILSEALAEVQRPGVDVVFSAEAVGAPEAAAAPATNGVDALVAAPVGQVAAGLNERYSFDTFIVGPSNQFAHAACRAVAEAPSRSYNPLFIYGGVGLGKTHLMHAIGQYVLHYDPSLKLTYISSERFMNEMINALEFNESLLSNFG